MKIKYISILTVITLCTIILSCNQEHESKYLKLTGPYFEQKLPGFIPEVFAPGIISKTGNHLHSCVSFSPDGKEIYFTYRTYEPVIKNTIYFMKQENNMWTKPQIAPFSGTYSDDGSTFSPDGKRLYFNSSRPVDSSDKSDDLNFWYVNRAGPGWGKPVYGGDILNTDSCEFRLSIADNGTIYLSSDRDYSGRREFDIFTLEYVKGDYAEPTIMDEAITTSITEQICFISPDESYIVFYRYNPNLPEDTGLYISFRNKNDSWSEGKNMGKLINEPIELVTQFASLSPDRKHMFFLRRYDEAVYWVNANIIEDLKPTDLK
ncbi:hypothetical protein ACFL0J_04205 [Candidatus Neomarinimicrobiota bacterium]